MAWYSFLTGADVQKNIDYVAKGIDAMVFTDEEKSNANFALVKANLKALSTQSVARRIIAVAVVAEYFMLLNVAIVLYLAGMVEQAQFIFEVIRDAVKEPTNWVLGFYFMTGIVGKWNTKKD